HNDLEQFEKAVADYDKAIELDPKYAAAYNNRGNAHDDLEQFEKAVADYDKAIELDPKYAAAYNNRGNVHYDLEQFEKAVADYDKAIELDPKDAIAYKNRGRLRFILGQFVKAEQDLTKSTKLRTTDGYTVIWNHLSRARAGNLKIDMLRGDAKMISFDVWPGPVISMFLGTRTPEEVQAAAQNDDPSVNRDQLCEAQFYIGQLRLVEGRGDEAALLFRNASDTCPKSFVEYAGSKAELRRMGAE
ncbi:tetratricopeptide repeat protein, partial [Pelagibius sp.]|uniref:tetratricopeptide repeat protein n=1 Tax=Pelagibius sp. TaxID=1931238 RepID=UPI0026183EEA